MNKALKYYIDKENKVKEMIFISYDTDKLYLLSPKRQRKEEIKVNNILITDTRMIEKIVKKKIEMKLDKYIKALQILTDDDDTDWGTISQILLDAEKFRMKLINEYVRYLGKTYRNLALDKIELIIKELRSMRSSVNNKHIEISNRGRRGR